MAFTITKDFAFSASHVLHGLPEGHQCGRLHGHNYVIRVELEGQLDSIGFVRDYGDLKPLSQWIDDTLDHQHLNDVLLDNPTAEHLAAAVFHVFTDDFPELVAVSVQETPKCWATYRP